MHAEQIVRAFLRDVPHIFEPLDEIEEFLAENGNGIIVDFENRRPRYQHFQLFNEKLTYRFDERGANICNCIIPGMPRRKKLVKIYENILPAEKKTLSAKLRLRPGFRLNAACTAV